MQIPLFILKKQRQKSEMEVFRPRETGETGETGRLLILVRERSTELDKVGDFGYDIHAGIE